MNDEWNRDGDEFGFGDYEETWRFWKELQQKVVDGTATSDEIEAVLNVDAKADMRVGREVRRHLIDLMQLKGRQEQATILVHELDCYTWQMTQAARELCRRALVEARRAKFDGDIAAYAEAMREAGIAEFTTETVNMMEEGKLLLVPMWQSTMADVLDTTVDALNPRHDLELEASRLREVYLERLLVHASDDMKLFFALSNNATQRAMKRGLYLRTSIPRERWEEIFATIDEFGIQPITWELFQQRQLDKMRAERDKD